MVVSITVTVVIVVVFSVVVVMSDRCVDVLAVDTVVGPENHAWTKISGKSQGVARFHNLVHHMIHVAANPTHPLWLYECIGR